MDTKTILRCEVGSTAHGTGLDGQEDLDEMSVAVPDKSFVLRLRQWEQDVIREDNGRPLGPGERSTPDTYELTRYSLHKWMRLAVQGNPSILLLLWAPVREITPEGERLRELASSIVSKQAIPRFAGYMQSQAQRLLGTRGGGHGSRGGGKRPELIELHSFDTKFAMHMVRLGFQGVELATTGQINLPMTGEAGDFCRAVRRGEVTLDEVLNRAFALDATLTRLRDEKCAIPEKPDLMKVNEFMAQTYMSTWGTE